MSRFRRELASRQPDPANRRWVFASYDQLTADVGPLHAADPSEIGLVLVESPWKAARRPYHKQKLALVLANMRHFALEQAARGVAIRHVVARGPYRVALEPLIEELGQLLMMRAAERELRCDIAPLVESGGIEVVPNEVWLTTTAQFRASQKSKPWRMDRFYRYVRRGTGILMRDGKPEGGKYSFDAENRDPWRGEPVPPPPPTFAPDPITQEVGELIESLDPAHPGELHLDLLPATTHDAQALWKWALAECLPHFGPYEDAMSLRSSGLFHTRVSALVNVSRLLPARLLEDVVAGDFLLQSKEGFVRQVLGWREFVRHVHEATDGLRRIPGMDVAARTRPGAGGYEAWAGAAWPASEGPFDGGAAPSVLGADHEVPAAFWGRLSGLTCLDAVVQDVWHEGYSHHITRLMVLSNLATLLDVSPRDLTDWFWSAYVDAYDWVVEPNVLGMGTFGVGDLFTTKPYISGAAYIDRMSDYCSACAFDPRSNCPITPLYWAFLARHADKFAANPRMRLPLKNLERRARRRREQDRGVFDLVRQALSSGAWLRPEDLEETSD